MRFKSHNFATRMQLHCTLSYLASLSTFQCSENCEQQYQYSKVHTIQRTTYITKEKKKKFPPCPHCPSFWLMFLHMVHPTAVLLHQPQQGTLSFSHPSHSYSQPEGMVCSHHSLHEGSDLCSNQIQFNCFLYHYYYDHLLKSITHLLKSITQQHKVPEFTKYILNI